MTNRGRLAAAAAAVLAAGTVLSVFAAAAASASSAPQASTNSAASPAAHGYPGPSSTGVPPGMALKRVPGQVSRGRGWYFDPRGVVRVTGNGAVLSGLYIPYTIDVTASHVTIKDVKLVTDWPNSMGIGLRHTKNVTIENDTISGRNARAGRLMAGVKDIYGDSTGLRVLRNNIYDAATGVQMEQGLISGNYIHSMGYRPGDHVNGITSNGGATGTLTISGNTIFNQLSQTDAIGLFPDFGAQANRLITGNLIAGGGYAFYGGMKAGHPQPYNIRFTNNRISTRLFARGGYWGPDCAFATGGRNTWSGNVWDATGQAIPAP
ncbi:MAG TPA: right-handed parallel beta-helix repeat-containing protein [Streptosporangiaceae bacterium]